MSKQLPEVFLNRLAALVADSILEDIKNEEAADARNLSAENAD